MAPQQKIQNQAYSEYKHALANILRSLFVARTPPMEARSPDCRSNVENAPDGGGTTAPASRMRRAVLGSRYVAIATQPVPRLKIRPIVHN